MPLSLQNTLLQSLIETSPYGILILDQQNRVKCWSALSETIFEIPECDAVDKLLSDLLVVDEEYVRETCGQIRLNATQTQRVSSVDIQIEQIIHPIEIDGQAWTIIYLSDVTERREKERRLTSEAVTDPLSGLENRRGFQEKLESAQSERITLAIIDADNFKQINDRFGHETGDIAIKHVSSKLRECFSDAVCIARLGGDEFGVVLKTVSPLETETSFEKFRECIMSGPPGDDGFSITVSIGVAMSNVPGTSPRVLLKTADQNMYRAKEAGRNRISIQPINA